MTRNSGRSSKRKQKKTKRVEKKPSAKSVLTDIQEITKAINIVKKVSSLPGMKSILNSLYGEKRYAEQLLAKNYPRIAKREGKVAEITAVERKTPERVSSPPTVVAPLVERTVKGEKISRGWRFAGAIKKNYSNNRAIAKMSKAQIRSEYRRFKRGLKTRIPEVVWYNPSP